MPISASGDEVCLEACNKQLKPCEELSISVTNRLLLGHSRSSERTVCAAASAGAAWRVTSNASMPAAPYARNVLADVDVCACAAARQRRAHQHQWRPTYLAGTRQDLSRSALQHAEVLEVRAPTIIIGGLGDKPRSVVMGVEQLVDDLSQSCRLDD